MLETIFALGLLVWGWIGRDSSLIIAAGLFAIAANIGLLHEDFKDEEAWK